MSGFLPENTGVLVMKVISDKTAEEATV